MKKILMTILLAAFANSYAITVIDCDGHVTSSDPQVIHHYHYEYNQPKQQDNRLSARYYRGEISSNEYMNSKGIPSQETYHVSPNGRNGYTVRKGW